MNAGVATDTARGLAGRVADPEIPVLTIEDLGILRDVVVDDDGNVEVTVTPTYSGCPAMDMIRDEVTRTLREHGYREVRVRTVLAPAWTTDWLSAEGRAKLAAYGIAPPGPRPAGPVLVQLTTRSRDSVACPRCGSADTREVSRFGSTACRSHHTCRACLEPFDHFKTL
ncbi:MAG TPA: 1,2-phenylacetyl-CoA epoxidase subunit PaaD [Actinomycetes bacterium]|nr:1,2-phenylacetyl-CoA epoxidase subunit PaaD [Actinomycetes bacterium]